MKLLWSYCQLVSTCGPAGVTVNWFRHVAYLELLSIGFDLRPSWRKLTILNYMHSFNFTKQIRMLSRGNEEWRSFYSHLYRISGLRNIILHVIRTRSRSGDP